MKNPILLEKEKSWGQSETPITRRKSPLIATIIKISSIGVLCTFFVRAIFRATLTSGHVGDTVLMIMRLFSRHVFSMKLSPCWYGCGKKNVEILGYKVTLFLRYERVTVSLIRSTCNKFQIIVASPPTIFHLESITTWVHEDTDWSRFQLQNFSWLFLSLSDIKA